MKQEMIPYFIIDDKQIIADKKIPERFSKLLKERLNICTEIKKHANMDYITILAPSNNPIEVLKEGFNIVNENAKSDNTWNRNIKWINNRGLEIPIGYISLMYCYLPKTREVVCNNDLSACPIDIREYIISLKKHLRGHDIKTNYNKVDNAIEILVKSQVETYDIVKERCEEFINSTKNGPFKKINFLTPYGTIIKNDDEIEIKPSKFRSYFNNSAFLNGLLKPTRNNIVPIVDRSDYFELSAYEPSFNHDEVRNFNIEGFTNGFSEIIKGDFLAYEERSHWYYKKACKSNSVSLQDEVPFIMLDNGSFASYIMFEIDETTATVNTTIDLARSIIGYDFDGKSVRDGLFKGIPHDDTRATIEINEYYKMIADKTRLLHYSDLNDYFEVYDLPSNWHLEDGVPEVTPKVFNNITYDDNDKDLDEISSILSLRTNDKEKVNIKK